MKISIEKVYVVTVATDEGVPLECRTVHTNHKSYAEYIAKEMKRDWQEIMAERERLGEYEWGEIIREDSTFRMQKLFYKGIPAGRVDEWEDDGGYRYNAIKMDEYGSPKEYLGKYTSWEWARAAVEAAVM